MITLYGIPNCDTVKKARRWLDENKLEYTFHDFKKAGIAPARIADWCKHAGIDVVLNKRGTTWRNMDPAITAELKESGLIQLMSEHPSLIKRPVVEKADILLIGFRPDQFESLL